MNSVDIERFFDEIAEEWRNKKKREYWQEIHEACTEYLNKQPKP